MPFVLKYASSKLGNAASHPTIGTRTPLRPITIGIAMSAVSSVEEEAPARGASAKTTPTLSAQSRLARNRSLSHKQGQRQKSTQKGDVRNAVHGKSGAENSPKPPHQPKTSTACFWNRRFYCTIDKFKRCTQALYSLRLRHARLPPRRIRFSWLAKRLLQT